MVSIILPTYNRSKYIRESIDSILAQTFHDWELIVIDDCSSDETYSIHGRQQKHLYIWTQKTDVQTLCMDI